MPSKKDAIEQSKWFFIAMSALVLVLFWHIIEPFAITLVTAGIVAIVLTPLDDRLRKLVHHDGVSAFFMVLATLIVIVIPLFTVGAVMVQEAADLVNRSLGENGLVVNLDIESSPLYRALPASAQDTIQDLNFREIAQRAGQWVLSNLGNIFSSVGALIINTIVFFVALYYFLVDRKKIKKEALAISPFIDTLDDRIVKRIVKTVRNVVFGALIIAVIQGVLAAIGMTIFGVPGAFIWGAMVVLAAEVPLVGVGLVLVPVIGYLLLIGSTSSAVGLLIWSVIVVGLVDNILAPIILKKRTNMHALLLLVSVLGGLAAFGGSGFIIGPTVLAAVLIVAELYKNGALEKK